MTKVTVYSNKPAVELFANGVSLGVKEAADHFFYFDVPNVGETEIVAKAGDLTDEGFIRKVSEPNPDYILKEKGAVLNWWDIIEIPGYASLNTKLAKVNASAGIPNVQALLKPVIGEAAQPQVLTMLDSMSVLRMVNLLTGSLHIELTKDMLMDLNAQLNKIAI